jgi:hypothetical protein
LPSPYSTAGTLINRAAVQIGLGSSPDPYSSADPNFAQLCEYLAVVGDELKQLANWPQLRKECVITTTGATLYPLPADYQEMLDQSGWNRSTQIPLGGPLSSQQWQYLKARQVGVTFNVLFRQNPQSMELFTPSTGVTIAFDYLSSSWAQDAANSANLDTAGAPVGDKNAPTQFGDLVLFDPLLVVRGLKVQFLQAKGMDTTVARGEYELRLAQEIGAGTGAPVLNLGRRAMTTDRLLDGANMPIRGWGS